MTATQALKQNYYCIKSSLFQWETHFHEDMSGVSDFHKAN